MKKVLIVTGANIGWGGVQKFLLDWIKVSRNLSEGLNYTWFVPGKVLSENVLEIFERENVNVKVADIIGQRDFVKKFRTKLKKELQENSYDIIHVNTGNILIQSIAIKEAKKMGVKIRVAHSHNASVGKNRKEPIYRMMRKYIVRNSTTCVACSKLAGEWLFGAYTKFYMVKNRINSDIYIYDEGVRKDFREKIGVSKGEVLIGNVGTINKQKNQVFLIPVIKALKEEGLPVKLLIIGENGEFTDKLVNEIEKFNLQDSIIYYGVSDSVNCWMQAMDCFVMPSLFEGFGIAALEAQAAGLKCFLSNGFPGEINVSGQVEFLNLDDTNIWSKAIGQWIMAGKYRITGGVESVKNKGYDIFSLVDDISNIYDVE